MEQDAHENSDPGEEIQPPGQVILAQLNALYEDKVEIVVQRLMENLQQGGLSAEAASEELVYSLLNEPSFVYMIWRLILTDEGYQKTEEELVDAEDANELLDWLKSFGGGVINAEDVDVLLCTYHPNKYAELLEYLMEQYPHVPQVEFFYLKNKLQRLNDELSKDIIDPDEEELHLVGEITHRGKPKIPPPLQPIQGRDGSRQAIPKYRKKNGRTKWLYENARIARMYQQHFRKRGIISVIQEIGVSPWFRIFFTIWLISATALAVVAGWHCLFVMLTRMFLPVDGNYFIVLAIFSCFVLSVNFAGSFFTAMDRVLNGWIFLDDETYFGDQDYSAEYNRKIEDEGLDSMQPVSNPPELTQCPHLLPCVQERTFLMLPGGKKGWVRRELWLSIIVLTSTILPFLYSLIWVAADSENIYEAIGVFAHWNIMNALFLTFSYWLYMWYYAMRKKYGAWRRNKESDVSWSVDLDFLQEYGLDERTVRRNIVLIVVSIVPLLITFWMVAYDDLHVTTPWIITAASITILLMCLREVWMSDSWKERIPYVIAGLIFVFFVVGLIGSIVSGRGIIAVFLLLAMMTQMLTVRHRPIANVDELMWLFEFLKTVYERVLITDEDAPPSTRGAEPKTPGALQRDVRKKLNKTLRTERRRAAETDPNREGTMVPCMSLLTALCSFPWCVKKCTSSAEKDSEPVEDPEEVNRGHWRLSKRYWGDDAIPPTSDAKGRYEPTDKLIQTMSPKLAGWFVLVFLVWCIVAFVLASTLSQPSTTPSTAASSGASTALTYPVCQVRIPDTNFNVVDIARLVQAANTGRNAYISHARAMSAASMDVSDDKGYYGATWTNLTILVISTKLENEFMLRDLDLWGDSMAFQVFSAVVPFARFFGNDITERFVDGLRFMKRAMDPTDVEEKDAMYGLTVVVQKHQANQNKVIIAGHGTNGGVAKILAARTGSRAVTFNAPGTHWLERRFPAKSNIMNEINIIADNDVASDVDVQTGAQQIIKYGYVVHFYNFPLLHRCDKDSKADCFSLDHTICQLDNSCFGKTEVCKKGDCGNANTNHTSQTC